MVSIDNSLKGAKKYGRYGFKIFEFWGGWLAQSVECAALNLKVLSSSPMLDPEPT